MTQWTLLCGRYICHRITKREAECVYRCGLRVILCGAKPTDEHPLSYCTYVDRSSGRTFRDVVDQFFQEKKYVTYFVPHCYVSRFTGKPVNHNDEDAMRVYDYNFMNESSFHAAAYTF